MANRCTSCYYYGAAIKSCDYLVMVGHSRGCPPGDGCRLYVRRTTRKKTPLAYSKSEGKTIARNKEMYRRYKAGVSCQALATDYGLSRKTIYCIIGSMRRQEQERKAINESKSVLP